MSRLPGPLEPLFPVVKRAHRLATRSVGTVSRRTTARRGAGRHVRSVPWRGTSSSTETALLEPSAVTLHVVGPAESLVREAPEGTPAGHPYWASRLRREVPRRHVLEIRDGLVVGDYAAHITPGGILDYETSDYYGVRGWREHPVYLRPRLPEATYVDGSVLSLATRGTRANYYHFVMDCLPRWGLFRGAYPHLEPDRVILNRATGYQRELASMLGLDALPVIEQTKHLAVRASRLVVPGLPNHDTMAPRWTTSWLRAALPARNVSATPRRIYVTRGSRPHTRRVTNEAELVPLLRRRGFTVVDPGTMSVQEQIDVFAGAEVVVAPHGAALTNLVFASAGVRVLELFAPRYLNSCYWAITDNLADSTYRYLVGTSPRPVRPDNAMLGVQDDITVPPDRLEASLAELLG